MDKEKVMKLDELKSHLKRGGVYRRADLAQWSKSVDGHIKILVKSGVLQKLSQGLYYYPKKTVFGQTPPNEKILMKQFLKDDRFLVISPNLYNTLGIGTTQLYNKKLVYNHKRQGDFIIGKRTFSFCIKSHFPKKVTREFLYVDLLNNLENLAEDKEQVLEKIYSKIQSLSVKRLRQATQLYGSVRTKKLLGKLLSSQSNVSNTISS